MRVLPLSSLALWVTMCLGGHSVRGDLVAYWPLDGNADDVLGSHPGNASPEVVFGVEGAAAHTGTAAEFDGATATITVPHADALNPPSFTLALWASADGSAGYASAITSRDDDGSSVSGFILYNDSAGRWNFWTGGGGPPGAWQTLPGPTVEVGSWTHLAISYDAASQTMSLHVNGALVQSATGPGLYVPNGPQREDLHLGSGADNGSQFHFDGLLDDVALWDEALTSAQIQEVMNQGVPGGLPTIRSFLADRPTISSGEDVALSWDTLHSTRLEITPGIGVVAGPTGSIVVSPTTTTTYTLTATGSANPPATAQVTIGVDVDALPPILNEFVADNETGLADPAGDREDWIEIYNPNPFAIDLAGWSLTDDPSRPGKWIFPSSLLQANEYLVVFASDKGGPLDLSFRLSADGEYLALVNPDGETIQEFAPTFPPQFQDIAFGHPSDGGPAAHLQPTPGRANGPALSEISPVIESVTPSPAAPTEDEALLVTARVAPRLGSIAAATLTYRIGFGPERSVPMAEGNDSQFVAEIPATQFRAGEMIRWFVEARTASGESTRAPAFPDPVESAGYFGTVVQDFRAFTPLPVLHWFVENPGAADTRGGTRASLYFDGEFYDNIFCRIRGQSTANWPKHKYKFDFPRGGHFHWKDGAPRVEEFNINSHYRDGYVRENGIFAFLNEAGTPAPETMYWWVRRNGEDFGLFSFVEQVDEEFLRRHGFDASGSMYKAINVPATLSPTVNTSLYRKVLRRGESYTDLQNLTRRINVSNPDRFAYVADHVNLPNYLNVMAAMAVPFNHDQLTKNYYLYLDPHRREWFRFPWDGDQGFPTGQKITHENWASPLYGDARHTQELLGGQPNPTWQNHLHAAILDNPVTREMYLRRLRTLADRYLALPPGSSRGYFEDLVIGFQRLITRDANRDNLIWSPQGISTLGAGVDQVINQSLPQRRVALFQTYGPSGTGLVPDPEPANPVIEFGSIEPNPSSGDQDHEFIELRNPNPYAVDLSGWTLAGAVSFNFPPGAVIPAAGADPERGKVFLTPDVAAFRTRPTPPTGGQGRLVLGNYGGHLSNFSETLTLSDRDGRIVAETVTPEQPSDLQLHLAISEIMYQPAGNGLAEFIELLNTSDTVSLDLRGVTLGAGIEFEFSQGGLTTLGPGGRLLLVRDLAAFEATYGLGHPVAGVFANGSALSNGGETIKMDDPTGSTIAEVTYADSFPWPTEADGGGFSLVLARPEDRPDLDDPLQWRLSTAAGGTPGQSDRVPYPGGAPLQYALARPVRVEATPAGPELVLARRLGADAARLEVQWSTDLLDWNSEGLLLTGRAAAGNGLEELRWRLPEAGTAFARVRVSILP